VLNHPVSGTSESTVTLAGGPEPLFSLHSVTLVLVTIVLLAVLSKVARAIATGPASMGNERYITKGRLAQMVEVIILYLRDTVIRPVLGNKTEAFLPYLLSLFFFILFNNLFGLIPLLDLQHLFGALVLHDPHWAVLGGTATGNIYVNAGLAIVAFFMIQRHALRELGFGGWAHHLLGGAPWYLFPIMVPIELMGMFIKPTALAIRLFANMLAGHTLMAVLAGFGAMALKGTESWLAAGGISLVAGAASVAITFLELFVAFLQAFIFMFLTTVFLGQMSHHGHDDHAHEEGHHGHAAHA